MSPRDKLADFLEHPAVNLVILAVILLNAALIGLASLGPDQPALIPAALLACLAAFTAELAAKLYADGWRFFRSGWNLFDLTVTLSAVALPWLSVLRLLRALPLVPRRMHLPEAAGHALFLLSVFFAASVATTQLYGADLPAAFGSLTLSSLTLLSLFLPSGWSNGTMAALAAIHPQAQALFPALALLAAATIVNLLATLTAAALHRKTAPTLTARLDRIEALLNR